MKITENIERGERITSLDFLMTLARQRKSVVVYVGGGHFVRPAAFIVNWSLAMVDRMKFYHAIKIEHAPKDHQ